MREMERLIELLRSSYWGDAWAGSSLRQALETVTAEQAAARPIAGAHSIWEIAAHAAAWAETVRRRLESEPLREPEEGDWPAIERTDAREWAALLEALDGRQNRLLETVSSIDPATLDEPAAEGLSSRYVSITGITTHNLYHAAQVAMLKRALGA